MNLDAETNELVPDWSIHPGTFLGTLLEKRAIRQSELAERTGLTTKHVNQIVNGVIGISGDVAVRLERVLGVPTRYWIQLDADYTAHASQQKARHQLSEFTAWARGFDDTTLRRHRIVGAEDESTVKIEKILKFFSVASPDAFEQAWIRPRVSFRRRQSFTVAEQNTALWLRLVERSAEQADVIPLHQRTLRDVARTLPGMTNLGILDGFHAVRSILAQAGVILTFVREVPGTRVCGATWWLGKDRPVIGVTERHRKPDILWFNIAHEIGHILLHPNRTTFLDLDSEKSEQDTAEMEADRFAEGILIPEGSDALIKQANTRQELALLSARLGVGATIVAGRHARLTGNWRVGSGLRGKITDADVDGLERL
ncbi:ImmA/IrrE family metallo-endopeptidase [Frankia sp. Cr1]|uniref:ImmA/IrrE family metallo-endopeptidase n=1 Tax=Frankia sp. Cr1 TaxID=3073931 RepID=UPI002AD3A9E3|nr:ImmA/IrrE family metallo-endopeptidase [Frankia sp. Cr1]